MRARDTSKDPDSNTFRPVNRAPDRTSASGTGRSRLGATPSQSLLALQRSAGNAAVARMLQRANEEEHHEHSAGCGHQQTESAPAPVQRSAVHDVLSSGGQPMDQAVRQEMEARLGADFSDVRLHTDSTARASAAEVGARAYTSGNHVVIGDGGADKHTLAHELTHVIQQRQGPVAGTDNGAGLKVSDPSDRFEREAEANATRVMAAPVQRAVDSRQPGESAADGPQHAVSPSAQSADVQRAPKNTGSSKQGEHIFNALNSLADNVHSKLKSMRDQRIKELNDQGRSLSKEQRGRALAQQGAKGKLERLKEEAAKAGVKREHPRFRSAMQGAAKDASGSDPNSLRYSELSRNVLAAVDTCGTRDWNGGAAIRAYSGDVLESIIIDQDARRQARDNELPPSDRKEFDKWFADTRASMHALFDEIITTADAMHDMLRVTRRGAGGYPDRGKPGAEELSDTDLETTAN
ncbi:eCIS core domain-containing protein [Streptomyces sclerotialus]|uniref:eCIS core domain-containing protein n=1 Tax=Streptomyces sclerotialus TaxID=1957 RepID=UPI00099C2F7F